MPMPVPVAGELELHVRPLRSLRLQGIKAERYLSIRGIGMTSVSDTHSKTIDLIELQDSFTRMRVHTYYYTMAMNVDWGY